MSVDASLPVKKRENDIWKWLLNPFHYIAGGTALAAGITVILLAGVLTYFSHSHFDGILDFHTGLVLPLWAHLAQGLVDWIVMGILVIAAGYLTARSRFRYIDIFGTQALARFPSLLSALVALLPGYQRQIEKLVANNPEINPFEMASFAFGVFVSLVGIIWMVVLMYKAYAVSSNSSGGKAIGIFIAVIFVGEVLSKTILYELFQLTHLI